MKRGKRKTGKCEGKEKKDNKGCVRSIFWRITGSGKIRYHFEGGGGVWILDRHMTPASQQIISARSTDHRASDCSDF